jgi:hypothetical protein
VEELMPNVAPIPLGQVVVTRGVASHKNLPADDIMRALNRHRLGDWGEVGDEDWALNDQALRRGERLLSAYTVNHVKVWIITEADRSATTILLPEEY